MHFQEGHCTDQLEKHRVSEFAWDATDWGEVLQAIALCLIFSGGTFLYAACLHVLPESLSGKGRNAVAQAGCVVLGSCLPLGFSLFHHH